MSPEQNKRIVGRFLEAYVNQKDPEAMRRFVDASLAERVAARLNLEPILSAFPDFRLNVEKMIAERDSVTVLATFRATHQSHFMGVAPTGKSVSGRRTDIFRLAAGKIVDSTQIFDHLSLKRQVERDRASESSLVTSEEPALETKEIQGNVLPGFQTRFQTLMFLHIVDKATAKAWLRSVRPSITSMADVLHDPPARIGSPWLNIAFSYGGLEKLAADAEQFTDPAFKEGMHRRSVLLGDPCQPEAEGYCGNWVIGGPDDVPDIVLLVGCDNRDILHEAVAGIVSNLGSGLRVSLLQPGSAMPPRLTDHEHFGYLDNISQPGIRGRLSERPRDYFTPRRNPADPHQGRPGQNLIWPGEFVFGYPGQDPMDKVKPGPISRIGPPWSRNGSLLVFRRLRQDVAKFHAFLVEGARELARREPALADLTPEKLAAKLMGRWRSGAPILRAPEEDIPALGEDEGENNHFTYIKPSPAIPEPGSGRRSGASFPRSLGDSLGLMCPHAAHIRRAYPRDATTVEISEANIEIHRLLRRGIPFGEPMPDPGERGLLFLAYQTSFERQFEFVTRAWLNNPNFRNSGDGHDPIIGQNFEGQGDRTRKFAIPVRDADGSVRKVRLVLPDDWVIPTGGGYFFAPSTSALEYLAS